MREACTPGCAAGIAEMSDHLSSALAACVLSGKCDLGRVMYVHPAGICSMLPAGSFHMDQPASPLRFYHQASEDLVLSFHSLILLLPLGVHFLMKSNSTGLLQDDIVEMFNSS